MGDLGVTVLENVPLSNGGGGGVDLLGGIAPPELPVTTPPTVDLTPIAPILPPPDPFPGAPTVTPPPLPGEPIGGPATPPPVSPPPSPGPVYPMPPGAPGSPENPIPVTGTGQMPQPPPFPPPPPGPVIEQPPPVTVTQTSAGGGAVAIATASINQAISIINQDVQPLATAVQQGIAQGAQDASQIAQQTTQAITDSLNGFTNGLFGWVRDLWQWLKENIGNILSTVANTLKDIGKALLDGIVQGLKDVGQFFTQTIGPILTQIGKAVDNIALFYQQHIAPILQVIVAVQRTVAAAITAIERDINSGLQGILRLPGDLANALSSIGNELIRAGRALQVTRKADANVYYYGDEPGSFAYHIKALGDAVIGLGVQKEKTTYAPGSETLSEPTLADSLPKILDAINAIVLDLARGVANLAQDPTKVVEVLGITGAGIWSGLFAPLELLAAVYEIMKTPLETVGELAGEVAREVLPLSKLDPATLTAAWRRNLIDTATMDREMLVQGYNGERSELLRRLSVYVEDAATLTEYLFRGVVGLDDFTNGLRDLGYTDPQIAASEGGDRG